MIHTFGGIEISSRTLFISLSVNSTICGSSTANIFPFNSLNDIGEICLK